MKHLYSFIVACIAFIIRLIAPLHKKVNEIVVGQKLQEKTLIKLKNKEKNRIWIHAASLGEYEMAIPLIQEVNNLGQNHEFIISFFSPSGYRNAKLEPNCTKFYLPFDTQTNAKNWLNCIQPDTIIFVKYEIWPNFLHCAHQRKIPVWYWNFALRENHFIFKPWAKYWRSALKYCSGFFCSNETTIILSKQLNFKNVEFLGDVRYLRTKIIQENLSSVPQKIKDFCQNHSVLILGSSWEQEESALAHLLSANPIKQHQKIIIAPHNIGKEHIDSIEAQFKNFQISRYSNFEGQKDVDILVIDNIGLLSKLYALADVAVIGGAFGKGLHNIIESAAASVPVIFGPNTAKFPEAKDFLEAEIGFQSFTIQEMSEQIDQVWLSNHLHILQKIKAKTSAFFANKVPNIQKAIDTIFVTK